MMAWHNHEENIKEAKSLIRYFEQCGPFLYPQDVKVPSCIIRSTIENIKSMIADAEAGHKRIEELGKRNAKLHQQINDSGYPFYAAKYYREKCVENEELKAENEELKKQLAEKPRLEDILEGEIYGYKIFDLIRLIKLLMNKKLDSVCANCVCIECFEINRIIHKKG
jgi:hypothetical protein